MRFARWVFALAGLYGVFVTVPLFFLERQINLDHPPAITHPEYFYGFAGLCLAWQIAFLMIAAQPARFRPIMLAGILEKLSFVVAVVCLSDRVPKPIVWASALDAIWAVLFAVAFVRLHRGRGDHLLFDRK